MTKKVLKTVTIVLCATIVVLFVLPTLSACNNLNETVYFTGIATEVAFNASGVYTTTVTASDVNIPSNVGVGDVSVVSDTGETEADVKYAEVKNISRKDDHTIEVTFEDADANQNKPSGYYMTIVTKTKRGKAQIAVNTVVGVEYPKYMATPNLSSVSAFDKELTLTLTLDESSYKDGVKAEDITLTGAFKKLNIASVISANKNLTLQLTGDMYCDESDGSYHNGGVKIAASAVNDSMYDIEASIPVEDVSFVFDAEELKVQGGTAEIPVYLYGYAFAESAKAGDFVFKQLDVEGTYDEESEEGDVKYQDMQCVSVTEFERKDASSGILKVKVQGADSENSVAAKLSGNVLTVAAQAIGAQDDLNCSVDLDPASFYAVFDYAEEVGDKYNFTLILNASHGTFNANIQNGDITFSDDFAGAELKSFALTGEKTAELKLALPSNGVKLEDMWLKGTVALAAGSMTNRWGKTSYKTECTRAYDYDTMGRWSLDGAVDTIKNVAGTIADAVTNVDNWLTVYNVGSKLFTGVGQVTTILEWLGIIDSVKGKLNQIFNYLQGMHEELVALSAKIDELMRETQSKLNENAITSFYQNKLYMMKEYRGYAIAAIKDAKAYLTDNNLTQEPIESVEGGEMQSKEWTEYVQTIFLRVSETDSAIFDKLLELYTSVCGEVSATMGGKSIVTTFDEYVANYNNFDTQGYDCREEFRDSIAVELHSTYYLLCAYNQFKQSPKQNIINSITTQYNNVETYLTKTNPVNRRDDGHFYMYAAGKDVEIIKNFAITSRTSISKEYGWFDKSTIKYPMNINDSTLCSYFNKRMHGGTLADEFKSLGYSDKNVKYYLSMVATFDQFWDRIDDSMIFLMSFEKIGVKLDMTSKELKYDANNNTMHEGNFNPNNVKLNTTYTFFDDVYYFHALN